MGVGFVSRFLLFFPFFLAPPPHTHPPPPNPLCGLEDKHENARMPINRTQEYSAQCLSRVASNKSQPYWKESPNQPLAMTAFSSVYICFIRDIGIEATQLIKSTPPATNTTRCCSPVNCSLFYLALLLMMLPLRQ